MAVFCANLMCALTLGGKLLSPRNLSAPGLCLLGENP